VILAIEDHGRGFRFRVSPDLSAIVAESDLPYIQDLLADFPERSRSDPDALFEQLSSLTVGVLVVQRVGTVDADADYLQSCCADFVPL
jgi:hypothetical protein